METEGKEGNLERRKLRARGKERLKSRGSPHSSAQTDYYGWPKGRGEGEARGKGGRRENMK